MPPVGASLPSGTTPEGAEAAAERVALKREFRGTAPLSPPGRGLPGELALIPWTPGKWWWVIWRPTGYSPVAGPFSDTIAADRWLTSIWPREEAEALLSPNGSRIVGTLERIPGTAYVSRWSRKQGEREWTVEAWGGDTKVWWDEQETVESAGSIVLVDENGDEWLARECRPADE